MASALPLLATAGAPIRDPTGLDPTRPGFALLAIGVALMGACVGSFLNVVAWRLPRQESVVLPPSHCPHCGTRLAWFENIPVLGWLALGGHCRHCGAPIRPRYPAVELLCAGLWVAVLLATPPLMGPHASPALGGSSAGAAALPWLGGGPIDWWLVAAGWLLASLLLPMVLIDLDHLWLPEPLCRWGLVLGLVLTAIAGYRQGAAVGGAQGDGGGAAASSSAAPLIALVQTVCEEKRVRQFHTRLLGSRPTARRARCVWACLGVCAGPFVPLSLHTPPRRVLANWSAPLLLFRRAPAVALARAERAAARVVVTVMGRA